MNYILISDWESTTFQSGKILETELSYEEAKALYSEYVLECYKEGNIVLAKEFVDFLIAKNHKVRLLELEQLSLSSQEIEDEIAEEIQAV